jgi:hypothetical protein
MQEHPPEDMHAKCNHTITINRQLARWRFRPNSSLAALSTPDGYVTSQPEEMAQILRDHWGCVF